MVKKMSEVTQDSRKSGRTETGIVVSNKMDKTIVVKIEGFRKHPMLKKVIKRSKKYQAHDPQNECNVGDRVQIRHTRPLSRNKRYELVSILERAK